MGYPITPPLAESSPRGTLAPNPPYPVLPRGMQSSVARWFSILLLAASSEAAGQIPQPHPEVRENFDGLDTVLVPGQPQNIVRVGMARLSNAYVWRIPQPRRLPPNFAAPGNVIGTCPAPLGKCIDTTMTIVFDSLVQRVDVSIGILRQQGPAGALVLARDAQNNIVDQKQLPMDTRAGLSARTTLQTDSNTIAAVEITVVNARPGLAIDDLFYSWLPQAPPPQLVTVPNIIGLGLDSARARLTAAGVRPGRIDSIPQVVSHDSVSVQSRDFGSQVPRDTTIDFTLVVAIQDTARPPDTAQPPIIIPQPEQTPVRESESGGFPWLIVVAVLLLGAAALGVHTSKTKEERDKEHPPRPRVTATMVSGSHLPEEITMQQIGFALTLAYDITSFYAVTYDSDD